MKNQTQASLPSMYLRLAHGPITALRAQAEKGDTVRDSLSYTPTQIQMDSGQWNLKNILTIISTWTILDLYWEPPGLYSFHFLRCTQVVNIQCSEDPVWSPLVP